MQLKGSREVGGKKMTIHNENNGRKITLSLCLKNLKASNTEETGKQQEGWTKIQVH